MKYLVLFFIIFINSSYSQNEILNDSVIQLEEVILYQKNDNCNKIKTDGKKNSTFSVSNKSEFVSLISDIPNGRISSLKLFFNTRKNTSFKKTTFRLKIYGVEDKLPFKEIITSELRFNVSKKKEFIKLDLSKLELINNNELYIGIELLDENENFTFSIDCKTNKNKSNTYYKLTETSNWLKIPDINIRMEIEVNCN